MLGLYVGCDCWIFSRLLLAFQRTIHHLFAYEQTTKGQKDYKRRKQQGLKDARLVEREDGMTEPITKLDDAFVTFYEYATGNFYLRFKEGVTRETPMSPRLESMKNLIPDNYPNN